MMVRASLELQFFAGSLIINHFRIKMTSLNQRAISIFVEKGYKCTVVESYCAFTKRKKDLFGIFDVLAVGNEETIGIQITSKANMSARVKKIQESDFLPEILRSKWRVLVIGFYKKPNGRYDYKVLRILIYNFGSRLIPAELIPLRPLRVALSI